MSERVLVVEDNERSSRLTRTVLEMAGMAVHAVSTGGEALAACAQAPPDIVLLDVQLGDIDGLTVLARLRADDRTTHLPVVALTAFAMAGDADRFLAAGFDAYLPKPIVVATFAQSVRDVLRSKPPAAT